MRSGGERRNRGDLQSENDTAIVLARNGFDIEQNPPPRSNGKKPDYLLEGDYWDCYTVRTSKIDQVRKSIRNKVGGKDGKMQADRIVLNFDAEPVGMPTSVTPDDVEKLLQRKPITGLKEVKVIEDGHIRNLDLGGR